MCSDFIQKFSKVYSTTAGSMSHAVKEKTACCLVSKKMVHDALSTRKDNVGIFFKKSARKINAIQLETEDELLQGCHTISSEPYFYDTGYKSSCLKQVTVVDHDKRCLVSQAKCPEIDECALHYMAIPVDEKGRCFLVNENGCCVLSEQVGEEKTSDDCLKHWKCCELCKTLTDQEIDEILTIKKVFERPLEEIFPS